MPNFGRFGFGTSETPIFSRPGIFGSGRFDGLQTWALNFTLLGPTAIASTQDGRSLSLPPRVRAFPTDGLDRFGPSAQLHDGARPMGLRSASPCPNFSYV